MNKLLKKIYGLVLVVDYQDKLRLLNAVDESWNKSAFEKNVYKGLQDLLNTGEEINILTLVNWFRENNLNSKNIAYEVASLTSDVLAGTILEINQVLAELSYESAISKAKQTIFNIQNLIESDNFTVSKFVDIVDDTKHKLTNKSSDKKDNVELWDSVLKKHDLVRSGEPFGLTLPYNCLNKAIVLEPVDLMVIGARPAMGKTAFAISTSVRLAMQGKKVCLFALEMSAEQIMRRIIGHLSEVDTNRIKYGELSAGELQQINESQSKEILDRIIIYEGSHNIQQIQERVSQLKIENSIDVFIVDYLQKVMSKKASRYEQVTEISNRLKLISQNLEVPCIALAQLSRDSARSGKLPSLPDLRESGEIEQDASIVAFLHRPEYYGEMETSQGNPAQNICEFLIAKNREGVINVFELEVDLEFSRFRDVKKEYYFETINYTDRNF